MGMSHAQVMVMAVVIAIVALLSPFYAVLYSDSYETSFLMYTVLWTIDFRFPNTILISFNQFWSLLGYVPFVIFRLGVPIQFVRYYSLKVSRFSLVIAAIVGEIPPILSYSLILLNNLFNSIICSLPFHLLLCAIIVIMQPVDISSDVFSE